MLKTMYPQPQPRHTPIYLAQVFTYNIAKDLAGDHRSVTRCDIESISHTPPFCLRLRRHYRTPEVQEFRDAVAREARKRRTS